MNRTFLVAPLALAGLAYGAPRLLKRAYAPPQMTTADTPSSLGLPQVEVHLTSRNGTELRGWFVPVEGAAPAVVVLHGWGASASLMLPLAEHIHSAGFGALFLDARNHGRSQHDDFVSMPRFAEDLGVAIDWLEAKPEVSGVGVIGHSVGAAASILAASQDSRIRCVVAVSSFAHPKEMMERQLERVPKPLVKVLLTVVQRVIGYRFSEFAPTERIGLLRVPVMLVHGDADELVPLSNLYELSDACPEAEVLIVPGAAHSELEPYLRFVDQITEFLRLGLAASLPLER